MGSRRQDKERTESAMVQHQIEAERTKVLERMVLDAIRKHSCRKVVEVVNLLEQADNTISRDELLEVIQQMRKSKKIELSEPSYQGSFINYITNIYNIIGLLLTVATVSLVLFTTYYAPQIQPWSTIRIVAGSAFVLFIPGYTLAQLLYPKGMISIERTVLGIAMNLAMIPLLGLLLIYTSGLQLDPIIAILSISSIAMSLAAVYRSYIVRKHIDIER